MGYTADLTGGLAYVASSEYSASYQDSYAFDDSEGSLWYANGYVNQWVGVDFGDGNDKTITKVRMICNPSRLQAFKIQGKDFGGAWTDVYSGTRANNTSWQEFTFENSTAYRYYNIFCNGALFAGSNVGVTEAEMMETEEIVVDPPVLSSATSDNTQISLTFDKDMADPTGMHGDFSWNDGSGARTFSAAALDGSDSKIIILTISGDIIQKDNAGITVGYTEGTLESSDGGVLATFTDQAVTNNSMVIILDYQPQQSWG